MGKSPKAGDPGSTPGCGTNGKGNDMNPNTIRVTFDSDCTTDTIGGLLHGWVVTVYDFLGTEIATGEVDGPNTDEGGLFITRGWEADGGLHLEDVQIPWRDVANIKIA